MAMYSQTTEQLNQLALLPVKFCFRVTKISENSRTRGDASGQLFSYIIAESNVTMSEDS